MDPKPGKKSKGANHPAGGNGIAEIKELITQMESFIKEGDALASMQIRRVEAMKETLKTVANRLGGQLKEKDETIRSKESRLKEMEETFAARIRQMEVAPEAGDAAEVEDSEQEKLSRESPDAVREKPGLILGELEGKLAGGPGGLKELLQDSNKHGDTDQGNKREFPAQNGSAKPEKQVKRIVGQDQKKLRLASLLGPSKKG